MMLLLIIGSFIYMGMYIYAYVYKYMRCVQKITRITENLVGLESTIVKHFFFIMLIYMPLKFVCSSR